MPTTGRTWADAVRLSVGTLTVLPVPGDAARQLYEARLALIRPDQIVAWRGNDAGSAAAVLSKACGLDAASA